jgi:hypothetical protein
MKLFPVIALLLAAVPAWTAEVYTFNLLPADGNISGAPGATIGWGYSIENQSTSHWLVTTGVAPGAFQFGTPALLFDFPILAPNTTWTSPYDALTQTGLMSLTWDASVPANTVESGTFVVNAEWWNGDPLNGGQFESFASTANVQYSASAVPEPGTAALLVTGIAIFLVTAGKRRYLPPAQLL